MPKYEIKREFSSKPANECYQAGLRTLQSAGYKIVKRRDIASLAICQTLIQGSRVDLNLMVPMGKPTNVILNLSSERADETSLKMEAERVLGILSDELGRG
jgi:hypothetical protein